jgi:hypothetical protein
MRRWVPACLLLAAALSSGCGSKSVEGNVGDELEAGSIRATVSKVSSQVPRASGDVTGLSSAGPGNRLLGVHLNMCKTSEQAVNTAAFELELEGGDKAGHKFPQTAYSDSFESVRKGCERGWMVFEAPRSASPSAVAFKYDDTGQSGPSGNDGEHVRFKWKVANGGD